MIVYPNNQSCYSVQWFGMERSSSLKEQLHVAPSRHRQQSAGRHGGLEKNHSYVHNLDTASVGRSLTPTNQNVTGLKNDSHQ